MTNAELGQPPVYASYMTAIRTLVLLTATADTLATATAATLTVRVETSPTPRGQPLAGKCISTGRPAPVGTYCRRSRAELPKPHGGARLKSPAAMASSLP
jgi:hypothetical protein